MKQTEQSRDSGLTAKLCMRAQVQLRVGEIPDHVHDIATCLIHKLSNLRVCASSLTALHVVANKITLM